MCKYVIISSVRVSNELGAGHPKSTSFSVVVVTVISFVISVVSAIVVLLLRDVISYAFTEGEVVAAAVSDLCPLLALTLLLNGVQPVLSGKYYNLSSKILKTHENHIRINQINQLTNFIFFTPVSYTLHDPFYVRHLFFCDILLLRTSEKRKKRAFCPHFA